MKIAVENLSLKDDEFFKVCLPCLEGAKHYVNDTITLVPLFADMHEYIREALRPAPKEKILKVIYAHGSREARVTVDPRYLGKFLGRRCSNVATAAKLLDIKIEITCSQGGDVSGSNGTHKTRQEKAQEREARREEKDRHYLEQKQRRLGHPGLHRHRRQGLDSHMLAQMLIPLDRSMNAIRRLAGGRTISVRDAAEAGQALLDGSEEAKESRQAAFAPHVCALPVEVDPDRENEILASERNVYAFVPSTPEGEACAKNQGLDAAFLEYRTKAAMQDSASVNAAFGAVRAGERLPRHDGWHDRKDGHQVRPPEGLRILHIPGCQLKRLPLAALLLLLARIVAPKTRGLIHPAKTHTPRPGE